MDNFVDYEKLTAEILAENEGYLAEFLEDLDSSGLKEVTIRRHYQNASFYLNTYLQNNLLRMAEGLDYSTISDFLGNFFIRKCMWSTPASIKTTAASLKKFYKSMLDKGHIDEDAYNDFLDTISFSMEDWQADCEIYNDPDAPNPFAFF